jgi:preprotein translocase subunit YajC
MTKHVKSGLVLLAGLLAGLLSVSGCTLASAEETPSSTGFSWTFVIFLALFVLIVYFLMIRPQHNRQNQQRKLLNELKPGDQVITAGGIYGEIESVDEESMIIKVESGAKIRISRQSIAGKRS